MSSQSSATYRLSFLPLLAAAACGSVDEGAPSITNAGGSDSAFEPMGGVGGTVSVAGAGGAAGGMGGALTPPTGDDGGSSTETGGSGGVGGDSETAGSAGEGGAAAGAGGEVEAGGGSGGTGGVQTPPTLGKFVGNITTRFAVRDDLVEYWDQLSPENEGKWGNIERQRDVMTWERMDAVRDYAREHGIPYKGHTLVWGSQQPTWLNGLPENEQRAEVEEWIQAFCERYPDVAMIDVVNEPPPHTTPSYMNALGGSGASGYDWIVQSFEWARQYCPDAILMLNDFNNIEYQADNDRTIDIVNSILEAGAPIDAVGCQAHATFEVRTSTVENFINRIGTMTGLPVYITEFDIDLADDQRQRDVMEEQFSMFWNNEHVAGITLWGYISGQTWKRNTGLMSSDGQQRPAMIWLMDFLDR